MSYITPPTRREQKVLDTLVSLIEQGIEYPEAEAKATKYGMDMDSIRCRDLYDDWCVSLQPGR